MTYNQFFTRRMNEPWSRFFQIALLACFAITGGYCAIGTGISADEEVELQTYFINLAAVSGWLNGDERPFQMLMAYHDRYYGVGFHWLSHGLAGVMSEIFEPVLRFSSLGSRLIWAHLTNFFAFLVSGVLIRQIILLLTQDRFISSLSMFVFLLWPYLLGHAFMNVKDIPFMLIWLACTYQMMRLFQLMLNHHQYPLLGSLVLGVLTGWLISIRVSGVLIAIQYFWFYVFLMIEGRLQVSSQLTSKKLFICWAIIFFGAGVSLLILFPVLWSSPFELINSINYMSSHPWQGNTLTGGELIEPKTRLLRYLLSWFYVKLPLVVILGLLLLPFALFLGVQKQIIVIQKPMLWALTISIISILCLLVIKRVALYNELRQILFIFPLLWIIAITSLYRVSRKCLAGILFTSSIVMVIDNISLYPYQYSYLNEISRFTQAEKKFETDYYGLSIAQTAHWLNNSKIDGAQQCLFVPSPHQWKYYLNRDRFPCLDGFPGDLSLIREPFLFFVPSRGGERFRAPPGCTLKHEELRRELFSGSVLMMGELYECRPPKPIHQN